MAQQTAGDRNGVKLFTVRGIELRIDWSWFIVFALVLFSLSLGYFPQVYPNQPYRLYWIT
jgi:hypothetical protein